MPFDFTAKPAPEKLKIVFYAKEFLWACLGLFVIDIAWRIMDNFIDLWFLVHFPGFSWLIGEK